jgi:hypothetical protein
MEIIMTKRTRTESPLCFSERNNRTMVNIYAIVPMKGKKVEVLNWNDADEGTNTYNNFFIGGSIPQQMKFGDNVHDNIFITSIVDLNKFKSRLKFCFKLLFKYDKSGY